MTDNARMSLSTCVRRGPWLRQILLRILLLVLVATTTADAQPAAPRPDADEGFLAMDIFGGTHPQGSTATGPNVPDTTFGWEIGSSLRFRRAVGIAAGVGRVRTPERAWITHVQAGPRVYRQVGGLVDVRGFAHVLVGRAFSEQRSGATDGSLELMAGGGVDVFNVFRFELDLVRRDLDTFPRTGGRFLFGVALPLCFRGCGPADGFAVRGE